MQGIAGVQSSGLSEPGLRWYVIRGESQPKSVPVDWNDLLGARLGGYWLVIFNLVNLIKYITIKYLL